VVEKEENQVLDIIIEVLTSTPAIVVYVALCLFQAWVTLVAPTSDAARQGSTLVANIMFTGAAIAGPDVFVTYMRLAIPACLAIVILTVARVVLRGRRERGEVDAVFAGTRITTPGYTNLGRFAPVTRNGMRR
jgi:hypothetical protein